MGIFLNILSNNLLPVFMLAATGFLMGKAFKPDINTLTKFNFYVYVPLFTFANLVTADLSADMYKVAVIAVIMLVLNGGISFLLGKILRLEPSFSCAFANSIMFYNSGNFGLPIVTLVFSSAPFVIAGATPYLSIAVTAQVMVLAVQNLTTNTIGYYLGGRAKVSWREALKKLLAMPVCYAVPLAILFRFLPFDLSSTVVWPAIDYIKNGMVSIALLTLGVQLSRTDFKHFDKKVLLTVFFRLLGGPLLALGLILIFRLDGIVAQTLMISSAVPTSVNSALLAVEWDNHPDFATQAVTWTTVLCAVTMTITIYLARVIFPV